MRKIDISTEVFARIWALRTEGEEDENSILERLLFAVKYTDDQASNATSPGKIAAERSTYMDRGPRTWSQPTWATDIADVIKAVGGSARLQRIYSDVRVMRQAAGRSVPRSLEATIRRTLENHSSDSHNYTGGADIFCMPEGKGAGIWALRPQFA